MSHSKRLKSKFEIDVEMSMTLKIQAETAPIKIDQDGAARVGGTRVGKSGNLYTLTDREMGL